jgi:response regulator RpfG family c-di-GMP phosphodiesterase
VTATTDVPKATILAVDDEIENIELMRRCLAMRPDLNLLVAYSGSQALALLRSQPVDVLVVDQRMPEMSGVELVECAQNMARVPTAIMLTAYPEDPDVVHAHTRGMLHCIISKPWRIDDLILAIDLVLKMRKHR